MSETTPAGQLQKIARDDEPVFFLKRDSPDEWCAAVDRGEMFVLGARIVFLESVGV